MVHSLIYCNRFSCHFWWDVESDRFSSDTKNPCSSQSFSNDSTARVSWRSITVTNKSNSLTYTVASSLVCTSVRCSCLQIFLENLFDLLLELGGPVSRWMFSVPDLLQRILFVYLRLGICFSIFFGKYYVLCIESFCVDFRCVHRFPLLNVCHHYVTLPNSTRVQHIAKEQSR